MAATVTRLRTRRDRLKAEQAMQLRQAVLALEGAPEDAKSSILAVIDRETAAQEGWTFIMISAEQYGAVVEWLAAHSKRPVVALRLWALLFQHVRRDTQEIALGRTEIAEQLGIHANHVSNLMAELECCGAVQRRRDRIPGRRGAHVRFFLNPHVGTHLTGAARDKAQQEAAPPLLRLVETPAP